jgi:hypothetical protein
VIGEQTLVVRVSRLEHVLGTLRGGGGGSVGESLITRLRLVSDPKLDGSMM